MQGGGQILSVMPPTQMVQAQSPQQASVATAPVANTSNASQQQQQPINQQQQQLVLQGINLQQQQQQQQQLGGIQIVQQVVGPNGEIQQIPVSQLKQK